MSPSPEARDDLARVLLAVNQGLIVTAIDPVKFNLKSAPRYRLAVLEDSYDPGLKADARLIIYPPPWLEHSAPPSWQLPVTGTVATAADAGTGRRRATGPASRAEPGAHPEPAAMDGRAGSRHRRGDQRIFSVGGFRLRLARRSRDDRVQHERPHAARSRQAGGAGADRGDGQASAGAAGPAGRLDWRFSQRAGHRNSQNHRTRRLGKRGPSGRDGPRARTSDRGRAIPDKFGGHQGADLRQLL